MSQSDAGDPAGDRTTEIAASWDANAEAWTQAVRSGAIRSRRAGTDAAILAAIRRVTGRRVLDVGCGEGWLARAIAPDGFDVTGIDGSAALIERARASGGGRFHVMAYETFSAHPDSAGGPFDVAVLNFALLADVISPLLSAVREILAPDGILLIQTLHPVEVSRGEPYRDGWRVETFGSLDGFDQPMPWYFRTLASWTDELQRAGFVIECIDEPADESTGRPLSILFAAIPRR